jgi:hypothetical protein
MTRDIALIIVLVFMSACFDSCKGSEDAGGQAGTNGDSGNAGRGRTSGQAGTDGGPDESGDSGASGGTGGSSGSGGTGGLSGSGGTVGIGGTGATGGAEAGTGYTNNDDETVTDEATGLTWMRCAAGRSGSDCSTGSTTGYEWQDGIDYCDNLNFAGHDDWRLPEIRELESIIDYTSYSPAIDSTAFPADPNGSFWSSSSDVYEPNFLTWNVTFGSGNVSTSVRPNTFAVRCVRGGPLVIGSFESSVISGDRIIKDTTTGLVWQGCPAGQSGSDCSTGSTTRYNWRDALNYCDNLTWADYSDWRLPNVNELVLIVDFTKHDPAIDSTAFPATAGDRFWSSSSVFSYTDYAWYVGFDWGGVGNDNKTREGDVRCVRGGP